MADRAINQTEEARAILQALGVPSNASAVYLALLQSGAVLPNQLGEKVGLSPAAAEQAADYLKLFRLVSQDVDHGRPVLFASDPRFAWKAHDADFYWMRSIHVGDIEKLPPLPEMRDEERRRLYGRLERICGAIYDANGKAHDPLRHAHRDIPSGELFASWLAVTIAGAAKSVVAVEMPPRLPDLAPVWVALTRRIRAGVTYTRIVGIDEVVEHGLEIVTRDINDYGIDLRLAPQGFIMEAFYIVDGKRLLVKNVRRTTRDAESPHFGVYTSKFPIVRRYNARFAEHYRPASVGAMPTIERLGRHAATVAEALRAAHRPTDAEVFRQVAAFGKFVQLSVDATSAAERLVVDGHLVRNSAGYTVMALPVSEVD